MIEMRIYGLTLDAQSKSPVVILRDMDNDVMLPIWVGPMEAMAISLVLNKERLPRPLTHDLFLLTLRGLKANLRRVEIIDYKDGVYYAALVIYGQEGRIRVDCRPSDAIALAVRMGAPIMVAAHVLQLAEQAQEQGEPLPQRDNIPPQPDAATDLVRRASARKEADLISGMLLRYGSLPPATPQEADARYQELLRSLDPVSRNKM